jgi:hypothetical protein
LFYDHIKAVGVIPESFIEARDQKNKQLLLEEFEVHVLWVKVYMKVLTASSSTPFEEGVTKGSLFTVYPTRRAANGSRFEARRPGI